ncbi:hydantoinase/oxoprolinase N-terminal domain-containing protein [Vulcanisaeta souniana]|uniref:Hydantoinase subunit beta n=1 Tax=Vulcanisaeta souniana JCM 11219 TaxID=1293586 RepID=A0A830EFI4_9CREN|nr:hydantoinase/oxoprolinase family protein [Vulcanisaeta souniana]BDR91023.1 hydantoinase subunit beta [Vulcanisaeta souniana JCM 11219]GGI80079.1 hydantoinase subunit beta [Vulcanisaeta souniana JCM 11219]
MTKYKIGIDVGSTHTDAVILDENNIIHAEKTMTTPDVTTGIINALRVVLERSGINVDDVATVMFGTTHILNAIVQRRGLGKVGVIRVGLPATEAIEPMLDWPSDLRSTVNGGIAMIRGGHDYTGEPLADFDENSVKNALRTFVENKVNAIAVTSVWSVVNPEHELRIRELANELVPGLPVVLSHEISSIGLLERENATILNAATINVMINAVNALRTALINMGLGHAKMYFAQNDGTTASADYITKFPIFTVIAPVSNSIRGAYVLTGIKNAIVADTGGTTTNIGALVNGYPREALEVEIGGVRTNIRAPDIIAIGLAGGSIVEVRDGDVKVGPVSVGYRLIYEGIAWGGDTITATDIALAKDAMKIDDPKCNPELARSKIPSWLVERAYAKMVEMLEDALDRIKLRPEPETVILVGGGSAMWPKTLRGAREVIRPGHAQYANAIGAATALVGAVVEKAYSYEQVSRDKAIQDASEEARKRAIEAGADPSTIEVAEIEEIAMPYLPGNAVKIRIKAVGKLKL